jgi:hypothetical protein
MLERIRLVQPGAFFAAEHLARGLRDVPLAAAFLAGSLLALLVLEVRARSPGPRSASALSVVACGAGLLSVASLFVPAATSPRVAAAPRWMWLELPWLLAAFRAGLTWAPAPRGWMRTVGSSVLACSLEAGVLLLYLGTLSRMYTPPAAGARA